MASFLRTASGFTSPLRFRKLLVVIKRTAFEEYSRVQKLKVGGPLQSRGHRWKRLEARYNVHKACVEHLLQLLRQHGVEFACVNHVALDRQHLVDKDLVLGVGGGPTVLTAAHFLDTGNIPLLGIQSGDADDDDDDDDDDDGHVGDWKKQQNAKGQRLQDRLCFCSAADMEDQLPRILSGMGGQLVPRARIQCIVKSTFSETRLVPALNELLFAHPNPAAVSRFRMGWLHRVPPNGTQHQSSFSSSPQQQQQLPTLSVYGTVTRFEGVPYDVQNSLNVWSSGMWVSTATGSTAAMAAAGGQVMPLDSTHLQYCIREHMLEKGTTTTTTPMDNVIFHQEELLHLRWNSQTGRVFIDGSHLSHPLELGDEILMNSQAPPIYLFQKEEETEAATAAVHGWQP